MEIVGILIPTLLMVMAISAVQLLIEWLWGSRWIIGRGERDTPTALTPPTTAVTPKPEESVAIYVTVYDRQLQEVFRRTPRTTIRFVENPSACAFAMAGRLKKEGWTARTYLCHGPDVALGEKVFVTSDALPWVLVFVSTNLKTRVEKRARHNP